MLEVRLILSVEGIREYIKRVTKSTCNLNGFRSTLESNEEVICGFVAHCFAEDFLCDYSSPFNKAVWVCQTPPSGNCSNIKTSFYIKKLAHLNPILNVSNEHGSNRRIKRTTIFIKNRDVTGSTLPQCKQLFQQKNSANSFNQVSGYISKSVWKSLLCRSKILNGSCLKLGTCLQNKVIFLFGDSTIRQYFYFAINKLGLTRHGRDNTHIWAEPSVAYHDDVHVQNTTLYYRAHGPPMRNPGPPSIRLYIADLIAGLPIGGEDVHVVLNLGAHFNRFDFTAYLHRLKGIKFAIETHHRLFPDTKFIIRGQNIFYDPKRPHEWSTLTLEMILRSVFRNMKNVIFLNLWDVTTVWPLNNVHPPPRVLEQEALQMFSYFC